ncbi:iron complex outermembrane recepter protein [Flexibacter flexilis DSM 6793]|uniref:Iron complex outermembrane recepter protein n=1 Tax=Flexibacter flexilis DSM 6793 TaxID=927664 RepID=A0A1I1H955_9BACT|nr:TonB-dependent receptor [Flexibacter flexilis]SFC17660.1 iron complex outermembrane recepter protein [Flexibacter flexilis DSM 6793]
MKKHYLLSGLLVCSSLLPLTTFGQTDTTLINNDLQGLYELSLEQLMQIEIVTASQQKETLSEVPVPVTVITSEMIEHSGSKNLRDLLALFVPNMTSVQDHNEMNIAMRGVYSSSQQKILIMLNGHRLNSRVYSEANPDYSISLDKIKQIEILRGPASSLYGNVALTAVVNIITKSGNDLKGGSAQVMVGNYGQQKISALYGDSIAPNYNYMFWANYYKADGEKRNVSKADDYSTNPKDGHIYLDRVSDLPSIDLGFNLRNKGFSMLGAVRNGKYTEPYSAGGVTGEVYDYDQYRKYYGVGAGLQSTSANFDLKYEKALKNGWSYSLNGYMDLNNVNSAIITNPKDTAYSVISWREFSQGFVGQLGKKYTLGNMNGDILGGTQLDRMSLYDSYQLSGKGGELLTVQDRSYRRLLDTGSEVIYSAFAQVKHYFTSKLILNAGLRYDHKDRHKGANIGNISPRIALIYNANSAFNIKASYSNAFVDAPYWYRYNTLASYKGSQDLKPEYLSSWQLTPSWTISKKVQWSSNVFYNSLTDFIFRDPTATGDAPRYRNAGSLKSWGWENEITYLRQYFKLKAVAGLQYAISAEDYGVTDKSINNVPSLTANIIADFNPIYNLTKNVWFNISYRYIGKQHSPIGNTFKNGVAFSDPNYTVDAVGLWNTGVIWDKIGRFSLEARVYNLADTHYEQGGSTPFAYQQTGRWFWGGVRYKF